MDSLVIVHALMLSAWVGVGLFMMLAPRRFGNLVHDTFLLFPEVGPRDWGKMLVVRLVGLGLLGFAARMAPRVLELLRSLSA